MNVFNQKATYWATGGGARDRHGNIKVSVPTGIKVRWEAKSVLFVDKAGKEAVSKAVVYLDFVPDLQGFLLLGASVWINPVSAGADQILGLSIVPNLSGTDRVIKVWL